MCIRDSGSGSTLPGYYMYHGGTNPVGKLTTLMEAQDTPMTNYNDMPEMNYDFQAPIGEFGQLRPQYHLLRRLHLFLSDFGPSLTRMPASMPDVRPGGKADTSTLCWAARSNGTSGYVFVNNYERSLPMPEKPGVQFTVNLPSGPLTFPAAPVTVPADSMFIWPFNLYLGDGVWLSYATAQPAVSYTHLVVTRVVRAGADSIYAPGSSYEALECLHILAYVMGMKVPQDISLIGGENERVSSLLNPPLTTCLLYTSCFTS